MAPSVFAYQFVRSLQPSNPGFVTISDLPQNLGLGAVIDSLYRVDNYLDIITS
jgi:hypothetical protein